MKVIVQKFGGSSLRDDVGRKQAVKHVLAASSKPSKVVVVVSAMGRRGDPYATDSLVDLLSDANTTTTKREMDLLISCGEIISAVVMSQLLTEAHLKTMVLTGPQAGIHTTNKHGDAKITAMKCERLINEMMAHDVIIVPGFQGLSQDMEVTTLGRGGSDTTAAALGAALRAESIDIFTDVEGIMTADPKMVKNARSLTIVTYDELCNMAYQGAQVIHPRAVEIAKTSQIPIRIRATYSEKQGTLVTTKKQVAKNNVKERLITGIAYVENVTQIKVFENDGYSNMQSQVFKAMAEQEISVDFININPLGAIYTVLEEMTEQAINEIKQMGFEPDIERHCAKISAVGAGMTGVPGVTAKIVTTLANKGIQILQSADSHTTIWILIRQKDLQLALNALHSVFHLDKEYE